MTKAIVQSLGGTGTPRGFSFWMDWLQPCTRRAVLAMEAGRRPGLSGTMAMDIGTVGHSLMDLYYRTAQREGARYADAIDTSAIQWTEVGAVDDSYLAKVYREADRAFQAYRLQHSATELGSVEASEKMHSVTDFLGIEGMDFDIRPDLEVMLSKSKAKALGLRPGRYMVDHKFIYSEGKYDKAWSLVHPRFQIYQLAYAQAYPRRQLQGIIINMITRGREIGFKRLWVPPPSQTQTARMHALARRAFNVYQRMERLALLNKERVRRALPLLTPPMAQTECYSRYGACPFTSTCY